MRALVTGGDGFLGANLVQALQRDGHEVTAMALNRKGVTSLDALGVKCRVEYGDITDREYVERVVNAVDPQWVFHLAAVSIVGRAAADPRRCYATNIMGTVNVLDACSKSMNVLAVVVASSDKAYGDHGNAEYVETAQLKPGGVYETSKACADMIARGYNGGGMRVMVTRCANLYGGGDLNWSRLVPNSVEHAINGHAPVVYANAWAYRREWVYVQDACKAYIALAYEGRGGEAYNVGSGEVLTAGDMAVLIADKCESPMPQLVDGLPCAEIPEQRLNWDKIAAMGWGPLVTLDEGLRETIAWYKRYLRWAQ